MGDYFYENEKENFTTDFSFLTVGEAFPPSEIMKRNLVYNFNKKLFSGEYAKGKKLKALINGRYENLNYNTLSLNYFKLIVNKLESLIFSGEMLINTGDTVRDAEVKKLVDKVSWNDSIRRAIKQCQIYGDCIIKTYRNGVSIVIPPFGFKVIDVTDRTKVIGVVLYEYLYEEEGKISHIRFLIGLEGYEFERVFEYNGSNLGQPVRIKYKDRWIPKEGRYYKTDIDCNTINYISVNSDVNMVYGESSFESIKDIIFEIEKRISTEGYILDGHSKPILIANMSNFRTDEKTGEYYLSMVDDKYMIDRSDDGSSPHYLTWDGKLDSSREHRLDLMSHFYELSEMGRTFLSGEYSGNISEESLNNIIKSAIDRGTRDCNDIKEGVKKSLYVLCKLNNIELNYEDINIAFNIGRADDEKTLAEICKIYSEIGMFSRATLLNKFYGYSEDEANAEESRIKQELEMKGGE